MTSNVKMQEAKLQTFSRCEQAGMCQHGTTELCRDRSGPGIHAQPALAVSPWRRVFGASIGCLVGCLHVYRRKIKKDATKKQTNQNTIDTDLHGSRQETGLYFFFLLREQKRAESDTHAHFHLVNEPRKNSNSTYFQYLYRKQLYRKITDDWRARDVQTDFSK